ncbi:hypothetical protein Nepgr_030212 [Nepenthes gracilis]|uniref:Plastid lipid-associated protein/fibrillin conserved domain-containing protein n=1 Tax=Nepenthes gracilis TaxID=150966 RepID=A0AAD3TFX3_NEPGR|nr:hypothetical protein Nepgr_030212 [Nepenthes gracilis]
MSTHLDVLSQGTTMADEEEDITTSMVIGVASPETEWPLATGFLERWQPLFICSLQYLWLVAMAASLGALVLAFPGRCSETVSSPPPFFPVVPLSISTENALRISNCIKFTRKLNGTAFRAMAQPTVSQPSAIYAREMERLSAKESLLLALKDAGGFEAFVTGKVTEMQRIDVIERITALESLNPTPRPTTSPIFEGRWNVEWFGPDTPGLFAIQFLSGRLPTALANVSKLDLWIKDGYGKLIGNLRF